MRLNEIKGIKSFASLDSEEIIKKLFKNGFFKKRLGKGMYALAFELSKNDVLKVWAEDAAYEQFVDYCAAHQSNPYLIKTKKVRKFNMKYYEEYGDEKIQQMKFVRMEKLQHVTSLKDFGYADSSTEKADKFLSGLSYQAVMYGTDDDIPKIEGTDEMLKWHGLDPTKSSKKFMEFLDEAGELLNHLRHELGLELDLRVDNFGLRGSQIVFMDPVKDEYSDAEPIEINKIIKGDIDGN